MTTGVVMARFNDKRVMKRELRLMWIRSRMQREWGIWTQRYGEVACSLSPYSMMKFEAAVALVVVLIGKE